MMINDMAARIGEIKENDFSAVLQLVYLSIIAFWKCKDNSPW